MTYPETIKYLESFINYEKVPAYPYKQSLKLERIRDFLEILDNPQNSLKCIHVAGSKGKGSTCAFVAYILRKANFKVGLYTSPHLIDFRERIRILHPVAQSRVIEPAFEGMISKKELVCLVDRSRPYIEAYQRGSQYGPLSFFEVYTALAFLYFKENKVDFTVLETGLGGRLDATNVAESIVCAITPISYEHTQKLGNTLREIATEKAGIIKRGHSQKLVVITAPQEKEADEVIKERCRLQGAQLYEVGKDITYKKRENSFSLSGIYGRYTNLKTRLLGDHQLINASVAVGMIESLRTVGISIGMDSVRLGLYDACWPGRCEVVSRNPLVVLDGAQNIASCVALKDAVKKNFKYNKLILVLGISSDKDIKGICSKLYDLADEVILTRANNPRATKPEILAQYFQDKSHRLTANVKEAKKLAARVAGKNDLVLICGSLFVVGEFRNDLA